MTETGQVIYKAEKSSCRSFPEVMGDGIQNGPKRNYQILSPLDFLAEFTQHIPAKGIAAEPLLVRCHRRASPGSRVVLGEASHGPRSHFNLGHKRQRRKWFREKMSAGQAAAHSTACDHRDPAARLTELCFTALIFMFQVIFNIPRGRQCMFLSNSRGWFRCSLFR